jgi:hypothetical protein
MTTIPLSVEGRNGVLAGGLIVVLGVQLIVHVGVETAEVVLTLIVGDVRIHRERADVLEIDHCGGDGSLVFVHRAAADLAQFRVRRALPGTRRNGRDRQRQQEKDSRG